MFKTVDPLPGDFGLVRISGLTGKLVSAGQRLIGSGSYYTHAFVVVDGGFIVQAQPGGAERVSLAELVADRKVAYSDFTLTDQQRSDIVSAAEFLVGTPYSFLDYAAIGAHRLLHLTALERFVESEQHMICSQLVAECYMHAGIFLYPNRILGDVTPGDLAHLIGA